MREVFEETNLTVQVGRLLAMRRSTDDPREPNHLALFFSASSMTGVLRNQASENLAVAWFSVDDLPDIALINYREIGFSLTECRI